MKIIYKIIVQVGKPDVLENVKEFETQLQTNNYTKAELILRRVKAFAEENGNSP